MRISTSQVFLLCLSFELISPHFLLGDVNRDGAVNMLDVGPFVQAISTGTFQEEADVNRDGNVDLLDVDRFVDLLTDG